MIPHPAHTHPNSFAIVIQQLPETLRDPVCVFYLVLRALDTVEDDMVVPVKVKVPLLRAFHEHCGDTTFTLACGYGPYVDLMKRYPEVAAVFNGLEPGYAAVIADITRRMGAGMADFIEKDGVDTVADYDLYCHYVAGLVGIGLSDVSWEKKRGRVFVFRPPPPPTVRSFTLASCCAPARSLCAPTHPPTLSQLFKSSGLETHPSVIASPDLSNHMALSLQKTNIIRDYHEDINEEPAPRMFWPREIWGRFASSLDEFKDPAHRPAAVACLNAMVADALRHFGPALTYMAGLSDRDVLRFCAIPQVMAAHTLALCYNNPAVFEGAVKMRRGHTARVMLETNSVRDVYIAVARAARVISAKAAAALATGDPTAATVLTRCRDLEAACAKGLGLADGKLVGVSDASGAVARALLVAAVLLLLLAAAGFVPALPVPSAWIAAALVVAAVGVQPAGAVLAS